MADRSGRWLMRVPVARDPGHSTVSLRLTTIVGIEAAVPINSHNDLNGLVHGYVAVTPIPGSEGSRSSSVRKLLVRSFCRGAPCTGTALHFKCGLTLFFLKTIPFFYKTCGVPMTAQQAELHGRIERTPRSLRPTKARRPLPHSGMPAAPQ